jgi:hypothetical protein
VPEGRDGHYAGDDLCVRIHEIELPLNSWQV